ncbi:class I lanthipeptide [Tenacibaculum litopenaei]|jgi:urease gamma subunit|uniref:class I lanthipeptide n=1 Tax=Tenacibaculum litopenaei TaxID=396016 RepID=UPI0038B45850
MKKIRLEKGLKLNKAVITKLQDSQMEHIRGGKQGAAPASSCLFFSCDGQQEEDNTINR